ncbi:colicin E3-like toxin immunity protein [Enterobacteriaceae bacterium ESL0689]|nr:colicin E3-like toxin immunity protein [Enterobacteriaceae bacterium ESL0689]
MWYNKENFENEGYDISAILDNSICFLDALGLANDSRIYDGGYDVKENWLQYIQPYFQHQIDLQQYDYQLAFRYV